MAENSAESAASNIEQLAATVTRQPVLLGLETAQVSEVRPNEPGFSYLAKRLYMKAGYADKQALKAAMMLSALFMRETGDGDLAVHPGDMLSIKNDGALLIRVEHGVSKEYKVSFPEVSARQVRTEHASEVVSHARGEETALRETVSSTHLDAVDAFLHDTAKLRRALGESTQIVSSALLSADEAVRVRLIVDAQKERLSGYHFAKISFVNDAETVVSLVLAVHPTTGKVLVLSGVDGRMLAETKSGYLLQPVVEVVKSFSVTSVPGIASDRSPSVSEKISPRASLRVKLQSALRDVLGRSFILQDKSLPHFGVEAYTVTFQDQPGREFYVSATQKGSATRYRLSERLHPHTGLMNDTTLQNWTTDFDAVVEKLRTV